MEGKGGGIGNSGNKEECMSLRTTTASTAMAVPLLLIKACHVKSSDLIFHPQRGKEQYCYNT